MAVLGLCCSSFSLVAVSEGYSLGEVGGLLIMVSLQSMGSRAQSRVAVVCGLNSCGSQALKHRLSSCGT